MSNMLPSQLSDQDQLLAKPGMSESNLDRLQIDVNAEVPPTYIAVRTTLLHGVCPCIMYGNDALFEGIHSPYPHERG